MESTTKENQVVVPSSAIKGAGAPQIRPSSTSRGSTSSKGSNK